MNFRMFWRWKKEEDCKYRLVENVMSVLLKHTHTQHTREYAANFVTATTHKSLLQWTIEFNIQLDNRRASKKNISQIQWQIFMRWQPIKVISHRKITLHCASLLSFSFVLFRFIWFGGSKKPYAVAKHINYLSFLHDNLTTKRHINGEGKQQAICATLITTVFVHNIIYT